MRTVSLVIRLLALLLAEVAAVFATWQASAPYRPPSSPTWTSALATATPADALVGLVHLAALPAAAWLLAGTLHDLGAAVARRRRGTRRCPRGCAVPPWVQRVVDQAVGTGLALAVMAGPAAAATAPPDGPRAVVTVVAPPVDPVPLPPPGHSPTPDPGLVAVPDAEPAVEPDVGAAVPDLSAVGGSAAADRHVVAAGENLWVIARGALTIQGQVPTDRQVHAYWVRVIQVNDLPSGDPDLIHPGQVLHLPPLGAEDSR